MAQCSQLYEMRALNVILALPTPEFPMKSVISSISLVIEEMFEKPMGVIAQKYVLR